MLSSHRRSPNGATARKLNTQSSELRARSLQLRGRQTRTLKYWAQGIGYGVWYVARDKHLEVFTLPLAGLAQHTHTHTYTRSRCVCCCLLFNFSAWPCARFMLVADFAGGQGWQCGYTTWSSLGATGSQLQLPVASCQCPMVAACKFMPIKRHKKEAENVLCKKDDVENKINNKFCMQLHYETIANRLLLNLLPPPYTPASFLPTPSHCVGVQTAIGIFIACSTRRMRNASKRLPGGRTCSQAARQPGRQAGTRAL